MSSEQENIIKDKLLEFEVPFEEKYWEDFQKRTNKIQKKSNNHNKYYALALLALLSISGSLFLLNNNNKPSVSIDNQSDSLIFADDNSNVNNLNSSEKENSIVANQTEETSLNNDNNQFDFSNATQSENKIANNLSVNDKNKKALRDGNSRAIASNQSNTGYINNPKSNKVDIDNLITRNNTASKNQTTSSYQAGVDIKNANQEVISSSDINNEVAYNNSIENATSSDILTANNVKGETGTYTSKSDNFSRSNGNEINIANNINKLSEEKLNYIERQSINVAQKANELVLLNESCLPPPTDNENEQYADKSNDKPKSITEQKLTKTRLWEVGAYGGIGLNIPLQSNTILENTYNIKGSGPNLSFGTYFRYVLNNRINIETGFGYKNIANNFSSGYTLIDNVNLVRIDEVTIVQKLRSFEIPMGVNIRLLKSDWLEFSTGLSLAYIKAGKTFTDLKVENPLGHENIEDYQYLSTFNNYGIRKFDARVYAGLTFNVSPYVGFRMLINQGLTDRTNNDYYQNNAYNTHRDYTFSAIIRLNPKVLK